MFLTCQLAVILIFFSNVYFFSDNSKQIITENCISLSGDYVFELKKTCKKKKITKKTYYMLFYNNMGVHGGVISLLKNVTLSIC